MRRLHIVIVAFLIISLPGMEKVGVAAAQTGSAAADSETANLPGPVKGASPESLLNLNGTLSLNKGFNGSLDLSGWDVNLDAQLGPMFSRSSGSEAAPLAAPAYGHWGGMGGGGGGALNSPVYAVAVMGTHVFVGGAALDVDNMPSGDYIVEWDGSTWAALGGNGNGSGSINNAVYALAVDGTDLYVGGQFINVNDNGTAIPEADYVAKWDGTHWYALGGAGNGALSGGPVRALTTNGTDLYVGGSFTNAAGIAEADYLAKWSIGGEAWSAVGNGGAGVGSLGSYVSALVLDGATLYAGGQFLDVKDATDGTLTAADYIAKWNGIKWSALGDDGHSGGALSSGVRALAIGGGYLYAGGGFTSVWNGSIAVGSPYIAKWNIAGGGWSAVGKGLNSAVFALAFDSNGDLYAGGDFTNAPNGATAIQEADYIAKWDTDLQSWSNAGDNGAGNGALPAIVRALATIGSDVYVGGDFGWVSNSGSLLGTGAYLARWNGTNWSGLGAAQGSITTDVYAMAVSGTDVYVGGNFKDLANRGTPIPAADCIAKWDGNNWSALGSDGAGDGALSSNCYVSAIAVGGTNVYIGGGFLNAAGIAQADFIAKWNGSWSAIGSNGAGTDGALAGWVSALAVSGANLYVGGGFYDAAGILEADRVARWNGASWSALGASGGALDGTVYALATNGTEVYVGGDFQNADGIAEADFLAKWNVGGGDWAAVGNGGEGIGSLSGAVRALALNGPDLYVGGDFSNVKDAVAGTLIAADYVAKWDTNGPSGWSALGSANGGEGSLSSSVHSIAVNGSNVYVGGFFTDVENGSTPLDAADHVARWDALTNTWSAMGSGVSGQGSIDSPNLANVKALAATKRQVYVGGYFFNLKDGNTTLPYADYAAVYSIVPKTATFRSIGPNDGWVLESGENTSVGGTKNSTAGTFRLGDSATDQQYRTILHFTTATLSDTASIAGVNLKIMRQGQTGGNPFNTLGSVKVDIKRGTFGTGALEVGDFQAAAGASGVGTLGSASHTGAWYSVNLGSGAFSKVNKTGPTQLRLRFATGDNDNSIADYLSFYSGNAATTSYRPLLTIKYFP